MPIFRVPIFKVSITGNIATFIAGRSADTFLQKHHIATPKAVAILNEASHYEHDQLNGSRYGFP